jgi:glutamyl-tRNA reductase
MKIHSPAMGILAIGLSHASASQQLRGRFAFAPDEMGPAMTDFLERVRGRHAGPEAALLSTCNRTELYCAIDAERGHELAGPAIEWLAQKGGVSSHELRACGYVKEGSQVARHAFRVASGLESMVLGEPQILGQMKRAVVGAEVAGTLGSTLHQLFQRSFSVAKEVRSTTAIGSHSVSLAAATVRLAQRHFGDLRHVSVLLVGAGEMIQQVAAHFASHAPARMIVANRSQERAEELAATFGGGTMELPELPRRLSEFDVVVSCTASMLPIIGLGACERALAARAGRSTLMIDLAVPRDIEQEAARLPGMHLYSIDDLGAIVEDAGTKRRSAIVHAEAIIERQVQNFVGWLDKRSAVPLIQAMHAQAEDWRKREIARARKRIAQGAGVEEVLEGMSRGLTRKIMHGAFKELNDAAGQDRDQIARVVARVFLRTGTVGADSNVSHRA